MRAWVLLLALALIPTASAASARLQLFAPAEATSGETVAVQVRVEADGFWCSQPRDLVVEAMAWGSGAEATLPNATLRFPVDDEPYFAGTFRANGTLLVDVRALRTDGGTVEVVLSVSPPGDCFASDGWSAAGGTVTVRVLPPPAQEPAPPPETNETTEAPPVESNETTETPANETVENETQESVGSRAPPPGGGYIGDYRPPAESQDVPGLGVAAVAAVAAAVALTRKR